MAQVLIIYSERIANAPELGRFRNDLTSIAALIIVTEGKNSEHYMQLFPSGLSGYNSMTKSNTFEALRRFDQFFKEYSDLYGISLNTKYKELLRTYTHCNMSQQKYISMLEILIEKKRLEKINLIKSFQRLFLHSITQNFDNMEIVLKLYNQNLLKTSRKYISNTNNRIIHQIKNKEKVMTNGY